MSMVSCGSISVKELQMKKIISLFIVSVFMGAKAFAGGIDIVPTMMSKSAEQDRVWAGTFQLVWNDFMDKYVHGNVRFKNGTPEVVWQLNAQSFTKDDINDNSYYKISTKIHKNTKKKIAKAIKRKFKEKSDILDKLDLTPSPNNFLIYAMLKKDFEFMTVYDKLGKSKFGENQEAEYFGIDDKSDSKLLKSVKVLFYNSENDYAVMLKTKKEDEVYLYKTSNNKPFSLLYKDMRKKESKFEGSAVLKDIDELKIPNIKFFTEKNFTELENQRALGTNIHINQALETVKFEMNHKGVKLKSEAAITMMTTSFNPIPNLPRLFYFDDTFVIFLIEKEKKTPYFALRVNDITKFQ